MTEAFIAIPEINQLLDELLVAVQSKLGSQFVGLYLHGSLALGDLTSTRSDIDFVVVTETPLLPDLIAALQVMHQSLYAIDNPWAKKLEGAYISRQAIQRYDPAEPEFPYVNQDRFSVGSLGSDWVIQRHILRQHGIVVAGPPPITLVEPIDPAALCQAVVDNFHTWWLPMLEKPERLSTREYQAFAALTLCRTLFTLTYGEIPTKSAAAAWALTHLPLRWHALIQQALVWPVGEQPDRLEETLAFLVYVSEQIPPLECGFSTRTGAKKSLT